MSDQSFPVKIVGPEHVAEVAKQLGHRSAEVMEKWRAKTAAGTLVMFAAFDGDAAVAGVNILLEGAEEQVVLDEIGPMPMVNALGVNEPYRRHGLASQLMKHCEIYVQQHPELPQQLALGVEPFNTGARALYEKLGYQYHTVAGQDLFITSWPEFDDTGKRYMFETECLLMLKEL